MNLEGSQTLLLANEGNAATDKAAQESPSETETAADTNSEDSAEPNYNHHARHQTESTFEAISLPEKAFG